METHSAHYSIHFLKPEDTSDQASKLRSLIYQLRYLIFCERYGFEPENPYCIESDIYDQYSISACLVENNNLTAACRIVQADRLPMQVSLAEYGYSIGQPEQAVEISRLVCEGHSPMSMGLLLHAVDYHLKQLEIRHAMMLARASLLRLLKSNYERGQEVWHIMQGEWYREKRKQDGTLLKRIRFQPAYTVVGEVSQCIENTLRIAA